MRRTLFVTTAIAALMISSAPWAQEREPGAGASPAVRDPGVGPSAQPGGGAPSEKVQSPSRGENAAPGRAPRRDAEENGAKEPGAASRSRAQQPNEQEERGSRQSQDREERGTRQGQDREERGSRQSQDREERGREQPNPQESQSQEQREPRSAAQGEREKGGVRISSEQRSKLPTGFKGVTVREASNLNISKVRVGESIPREVTEYWEPIPSPILSIVPEWRDYRIVRIGEQFLVIDPDTFEIVYIFS